MRPTPSQCWRLGLIAAVGLIVRLAVIVLVPTEPVADFWSYFERARLLVDEHLYGAWSGKPDASYPPAYPLLLTLAHLVPAPSLGVAKLLNAALGALFVFLAGLAAHRLWGGRAGLAAAALAAVLPRSLALSTILASENLFAPLLLTWILLLALSWNPSRETAMVTAAAAGAVLGLMTLTRSVAWLLGFFWLAGALVAGRRRRAVLLETAVVLLVQHAVLLPWAVRNQITFGHFTVLSSVGGIDLFIGNSEGAAGGWYDWRPALTAIEPRLPEMSVFEVDETAGRAARAWIRDNPRRAAALYLRKVRHILLEDENYIVHYMVEGSGRAAGGVRKPVLAGAHPLKEHSLALARTLNAAHWAVAGLGLAGLAFLLGLAVRRRSRRLAAQLAVLLGSAAYFPLVTAVFHASTRYRWSTMDLLLLPAGLALAAALQGVASRRRKSP